MSDFPDSFTVTAPAKRMADQIKRIQGALNEINTYHQEQLYDAGVVNRSLSERLNEVLKGDAKSRVADVDRHTSWNGGTYEEQCVLADELANVFGYLRPIRFLSDAHPLFVRSDRKTGVEFDYSQYECPKCKTAISKDSITGQQTLSFVPFKCSNATCGVLWWRCGEICTESKWYDEPQCSQRAAIRYIGPLRYRELVLDILRGEKYQKQLELAKCELRIDKRVRKAEAAVKRPFITPRTAANASASAAQRVKKHAKTAHGKLGITKKRSRSRGRRLASQKKVKVDPSSASSSAAAAASDDTDTSDSDSDEEDATKTSEFVTPDAKPPAPASSSSAAAAAAGDE